MKLLSILFYFTLIAACSNQGDSSKLVNSISDQLAIDNGTAIVSISIKNAAVRLWPGESIQLSVIGTDMNNDTRDVSSEVIWKSLNIDIATVDASGLIEASLSNMGLADIEATYKDSIRANAEISVSEMAVSEITVSFNDPQQSRAYTCIDTQLKATALYDDGFLEDISNRANWQLLNSPDATLSATGLFLSNNPLHTEQTIGVDYHNVSSTTTIAILNAAIQAINIVDENDSTDSLAMVIDETNQLKALASLKASISTQLFDISANGLWQTSEPLVAVINNNAPRKGQLRALTAGTAIIDYSCGLKSSFNTVAVTGTSVIQTIQLNNGESSLSLAKAEQLTIQLWLIYDDGRQDVNLTDYAVWDISDTELAGYEIINQGTDASSILLSSENDQLGELIVKALFAESSYTVAVTIID